MRTSVRTVRIQGESLPRKARQGSREWPPRLNTAAVAFLEFRIRLHIRSGLRYVGAMPEKPNTVAAYLNSLPPERRAAIEAVRDAIRSSLDPEIEEGVQYGMLGYFVPHRIFPAGYHCDPKQPLPVAGLGSQKNHMALYLSCVYTEPGAEQTFRERWTAAGKKLDMGKSCVRFKKLDDVPLEVVARTFQELRARDYIAAYERSLAMSGVRSSAATTKVATSARPAKSAKAAARPRSKSVKEAAKRPAKAPAKPVAKKTAKRATRSR